MHTDQRAITKSHLLSTQHSKNVIYSYRVASCKRYMECEMEKMGLWNGIKYDSVYSLAIKFSTTNWLSIFIKVNYSGNFCFQKSSIIKLFAICIGSYHVLLGLQQVIDYYKLCTKKISMHRIWITTHHNFTKFRDGILFPSPSKFCTVKTPLYFFCPLSQLVCFRRYNVNNIYAYTNWLLNWARVSTKP